MHVWNGLDSMSRRMPAVVASIGKCDGVHLGHQEILRGVAREGRRCELPALLISFDPHPATVVAPDRVPKLIQTRRQKLAALESTGLTDFLILEFDNELAALSGERFFSDVLLPRLGFRSIHVGHGFRFGHGRSGDIELLRRIGERDGFAVHEVPPVVVDGDVVSSSRIRDAVGRGEAERARRLLGRPFAVEGEVVPGRGRGRELYFPTANLRVDNELIPRSGVYVTETRALAGRHASVTNVGVRPTFAESALTVETHLLDFDGDLYDQRIEVAFLARIRDEMRFDTATELADQIARDRAAAISYFQSPRIGS
ncbi:MAG TPA: bifunctional riboflavin kinase/FAD synthetase [Candidatus Polarisedimenticolaceae bacterium]|nr:bifunctional riboflavin kinase/FAD synthetase [Candidatus Polarisedimenticolaceae bacterium]